MRILSVGVGGVWCGITFTQHLFTKYLLSGLLTIIILECLWLAELLVIYVDAF